MKDGAPGSAADRLATGLVAAFFAVFGWFTLLQGGVGLKGRSGEMSHVTGGFGIAVACAAFLFATLAALLFSRSLGLGRRGAAIVSAVLLVPPAAFILWAS
jgi:hypothetical protein